MTLPSFFPFPAHSSSSSTPPQLPSLPSTSPTNLSTPPIVCPPTSIVTVSPTLNLAVREVTGEAGVGNLAEVDDPNPVGVLDRIAGVLGAGIVETAGVVGLDVLAPNLAVLTARLTTFLGACNELGDSGVVCKFVGVGLSIPSLPPRVDSPKSGLSYLVGLLLLTASRRDESSSPPAREKWREEGPTAMKDLRRGVGREEGVEPGAGSAVERGVEGGYIAIVLFSGYCNAQGLVSTARGKECCSRRIHTRRVHVPLPSSQHPLSCAPSSLQSILEPPSPPSDRCTSRDELTARLELIKHPASHLTEKNSPSVPRFRLTCVAHQDLAVPPSIPSLSQSPRGREEGEARVCIPAFELEGLQVTSVAVRTGAVLVS